jgi:hypothetical protein
MHHRRCTALTRKVLSPAGDAAFLYEDVGVSLNSGICIKSISIRGVITRMLDEVKPTEQFLKLL